MLFELLRFPGMAPVLVPLRPSSKQILIVRAPGAKKAPHVLAQHLQMLRVARAREIIKLHEGVNLSYRGQKCMGYAYTVHG